MDNVNFEEIAQQNNIDTTLFLPFVRYRFLPSADNNKVVLDVALQGIGNLAESHHHLELHLPALPQEHVIPPVQEHVITE